MQPNNRGWRVVVVSSVFAGLATISVIARLYARFCIHRRGGIDDYLIAIAWVFGIFNLITCLLEVAYGLGHEMATIPPDQVVKLYKANYVFNILYMLGTTLTRTSILFQLLRILTSRASRIAAWTLMGISLTYGTAFTLTLSFSCQPIAFAWNTSIENGHCAPQPVIWVVYASINAMEDLAILVLPIHALWKLSLPWKKKVMVNFVMALGGSVCIITIVCFNHLAETVQALSSGDWDFSYNFTDATIRAQLELFLGITCGCLPCLKTYFIFLRSTAKNRSGEGEPDDEAAVAMKARGRTNPYPPTIGAARPRRDRLEGRNRSASAILHATDTMMVSWSEGEEENGDMDGGDAGRFEIYRGHFEGVS